MLVASQMKKPLTPIIKLFRIFCPVFAPKQRLNIISM